MAVKSTTLPFSKENNLGIPANRLPSFKKHKWIYGENLQCSPSAMAKAGFYAITSECAKCHYCRKELDGWDANDIPWEEHKSHCPECPFINYYSSPPEVVLVLDAVKLERDRLLYYVKLEHDKTVAIVEKCDEERMAAIEKRGKKVVRKKK